MTVRLVGARWDAEITDALREDDSELRLIRLLIEIGALDRPLAHSPGKVPVITRFNLVGFAVGVSDVGALRKLLDIGAHVRGIRKLSHRALIEFRRLKMGINLVIAITDGGWFEMLRQQSNLSEVNFWAPSAANFRALQPGELFLFKLHAPTQPDRRRWHFRLCQRIALFSRLGSIRQDEWRAVDLKRCARASRNIGGPTRTTGAISPSAAAS